MSVSISHVPVDFLNDNLQKAFEFFGKPAVEELYPENSRRTIIKALHDEEMMMLMIHDGAGVLGYSIHEINKYRTGFIVLHVHIIGGKHMSKWLETYLQSLENIAELNDVNMITATGRAGWQRVLKDFDYEASDNPNMIYKSIKK